MTKSVLTQSQRLSKALHKTKFNIGWQINRMRARKIGGVDEKTQFMKEYIKKNSNIYDLSRIQNWIRTIRVNYKKEDLMKFADFESFLGILEYSAEDNNSKLQDFTEGELRRLLKDLSARKYDFQFKKKKPKEHDYFVKEVEDYLLTLSSNEEHSN